MCLYIRISSSFFVYNLYIMKRKMTRVYIYARSESIINSDQECKGESHAKKIIYSELKVWFWQEKLNYFFIIKNNLFSVRLL